MLVAVITTKLPTLKRADEKLKNDHEIAQIFNNIDEHCSDAECSDLYHQQTRFQCSACLPASEYLKQPNLVHMRRMLGPLSSTTMILMLGYVTTAYY